MQIPIVEGAYTDSNAELRVSYPINLVPILTKTGISDAFMRPADGIVQFSQGDGPGLDRGGIQWNGVLYRVMGSKLVEVSKDGAITVIGDVGGTDEPVRLDYSFDRLGIASAGKLYYYNGLSLSRVTDADLGTVKDLLWLDGYFVTTDGEFIVVTELNDPTSVNPFKYGSSEIDPDPIQALLKHRNEVAAVNRYTIEIFDNVGGTGFPFQRVKGASINKGAVAPRAACVFVDGIAFVGSGRGSGANEPLGIYMGSNGAAQKISTREIDLLLETYTDAELQTIFLESKKEGDSEHLLIHLPDRTLVFDALISVRAGNPVWYNLTSSILGYSKYRARHHVWCYGRWIVGDTESPILGNLDRKLSSQYGNKTGWEFQTPILYNENVGGIFHELELVVLPGRYALGADTTVWTSYTTDGIKWSQEKPASAGTVGQTDKRIRWMQNGAMRAFRIQKFRGTSDAFLSVVRLDARLEPLYV